MWFPNRLHTNPFIKLMAGSYIQRLLNPLLCPCLCFSMVGESATMAWTLESILSEYAGSPLAIVRQSACIWLLAVLKHAAEHPDIQVRQSLSMISNFSEVFLILV